MNLSRMYIISWFGNDSVRSKRIEYHDKQIEWAKKQGLDIYVLAQAYNFDEYRSGVTYLSPKLTDGIKVLLPGEARNNVLRHFYASDCDYAIIADNDSVLYEGEKYCDSTKFVEVFNNIPLSQLSQVDFFFPLNPGKVPFTKTLTENKHKFDNFLVFKRNTDSKGSFGVLKNMKKHYGTEFYYDELSYMTKDRKIIPGEDVDFGMNLLKNGYSCYMLHNIILKEYASSNSTWVQGERSDDFPVSKEVIRNKFNLDLSAKGHLVYSSLYKNNTRDNNLLVDKNNNELFHFD